MKLKFSLLIFFCLPVFLFSQTKKNKIVVKKQTTIQTKQTKPAPLKSTKELERQVQLAKVQEAIALQKKIDELNTPPPKPLAKVGAPLLPFTVVTSNETILTNSNIPENYSLILVLFNPGCGHCQETASEFSKHIDSFKHTSILYVADKRFLGDLKKFVSEAQVPQRDNYIISAENSEVISQLFEYKGLPQIMIYNRDKILQKTFYASINIDSVLQYLQK